MAENMLEKLDFLASIKRLTLSEVEQRLADLDAERAALSTLRRSLVARDKAKRRQQHAAKESRTDAV